MRSRVVFDPPVPAAEFNEFARRQGWEFGDGGPATEDQPEEYVWLAGDDTRVHWIHDTVLNIVYAMLVGPDVGLLEVGIHFAFPGLTVAEAIRRFTEADDWSDRVLSLSAVAATAPDEFDQEVFDAVSAALTDANEVVRQKAALVTFYARWPQFLPLLDKIAAGDPYQPARQDAAVAAENIRDPEPYPS